MSMSSEVAGRKRRRESRIDNKILLISLIGNPIVSYYVETFSSLYRDFSWQ